MRRVLVLGAGLVARPLVRYLAEAPDLRVTVADREGAKAAALAPPGGRGLALDVGDGGALDAAVGEADLVVSLLPYAFHAEVARRCIARRRPLITTSYVSPAMRALDAEAAAAGVLLLNEMGLDPGIDHMSALRVLRAMRRDGVRVSGFASCCGGLPAPDSNTNPWGYKFSWSPRGVLLAGRNDARYVAGGRVVEIPGPELFTHATPYEVEGLGGFEAYPNRDATAYVPLYGLEGVEDMFRGTLRYPGWCETLHAVSALGLLSTDERSWRPGTSAGDVLSALLHDREGSPRRRAAERLGLPADHGVLARLEWAGLFGHETIDVERAAPLDVLCRLLEPRMAYGPGERDMIVLRHDFRGVRPDGAPERRASTLISYGEPGGDSAMARTVSLPAAIAARLVLEGKLPLSGVAIPTVPEIHEPVLDELARLGIRFEERVVPA